VLRKSLDVVDGANDSLLPDKGQPHLEEELATDRHVTNLSLELIMNDLVSVECCVLQKLELADDSIAFLGLLHHHVEKISTATITYLEALLD
jgi:hypothetical protein